MNNDEVKLKELCVKLVEKFLDKGFDGFLVECLDEDVFGECAFFPLSNLEEIINEIDIKANAPDYLIQMAKCLLEQGFDDEAIKVSEIASRLRGDFFSFADLKEGDDVWCLVNGKGKFYRGFEEKVLINYKKRLDNYYSGFWYSLSGQLFGNGGAITLFRSKTAYINALIALTESQL